MEKILDFLYFVGTVACLGLLFWLPSVPKVTKKGPVTHYHGYDLNHQSIQRAREFTVLISNEGFGGTERGTGVLLDAKHVLTCAHMVGGPEDDFWIFPYPRGAVLTGKTIYADQGHDLAIIELTKPVILKHYAVFRTKTYIGEPITIIGNTLGSMKWFVSFGIISEEWRGYLLTDGVLYGGNSGGPWINERGEIVALTDFTFLYKGKESEIHGGISAVTIRGFLQRWKRPQESLLQLLIGASK